MSARPEPLRPVITTEQIQKRVKELGRQISDDYKGQTIQVLAVLENAFMFVADMVRAIDGPVVCQFVKPKYSQAQGAAGGDVCLPVVAAQASAARGRDVGSWGDDRALSASDSGEASKGGVEA